MALSLPQGPETGPAVIADLLADLSLMAPTEDGGSGVYRPIPVYTIDDNQLRTGAESAKAALERTSWRYVVRTAKGLSLVDIDGPDNAPRVAMMIEGTAADRLIAAALAAEEISSAEQSHEARLIDLGRAGMNLFWIHENNGIDMALDLGTDSMHFRPLDELLARAATQIPPLPAARSEEFTEQAS